MIYTAFGLPVYRVEKGDIKNNTCTIKVYVGPKHNFFENFDRTVNELKADGGWPEIKEAMQNPASYQPKTEDVKEFFDRYCK